MTKVLITDDEAGIRKMLQIALKRQNHDVTTASSGEKAIHILKDNFFDVVITDLKMPGISGLELLEKIKKQRSETEVILMTAHSSIESAMEAVRAGAFDYIEKPFSMDEMELTVLRATEQSKLRKENIKLKKELNSGNFLGRLVGNSEPMKEVINLIRKTAPAKASVLITGQSGTGKELVARALHSLSERSNGPFLAINCGAIPPNLLESELFGHMKGSFTGADSTKPGLFQAAKSGTVLLDEIGEMPMTLQVKLLRVLQEKSVKPVGGNTEIPVDVRIIASTNRNLSNEIKNGNFRQDLFYRLNVIHISIPPLKDRKSDIIPIAEFLLAKAAEEAAIPIPIFSNETKNFLLNYEWPGNVRELENMLERAIVLDNDQKIDIDDLKPPTELDLSMDIDLNLDDKLEEIERKYIMEALSRTGWNRTEAARILGITFRSLRYRMAKLDLVEK